MDTLVGILFVMLLYAAWKYAEYLFREWGGAYARWRQGQPLRQSEFLSRQWQAERERRDQEKADFRRRYERDNSLILNYAFRQQFRFLGLHDDIRREVLYASKFTCALCGKQPRRKGLLHLDHIRPQARYPELEYVISNLQALCASCNRHKHAYDGDDWREVTQQRIKITKRRKAALRNKSTEEL